MQYRHTQTSSKPLLAATLIAAGLILIAVVADEDAVLVAVLAVAVVAFVVLAMFGRLTVTVDEREIRAVFGWGWPRRIVRWGEVEAVRVVRNRWYHGWGIRLVDRGWMYNVAGFDAVELDLASGRRFRIGTDQPAELLAAIERSSSGRGTPD